MWGRWDGADHEGTSQDRGDGGLSFSITAIVSEEKEIAGSGAALALFQGISSGEMSDALAVLVGQRAEGLSASAGARLKQVWVKEYSRRREFSCEYAKRRKRIRHPSQWWH